MSGFFLTEPLFIYKHISLYHALCIYIIYNIYFLNLYYGKFLQYVYKSEENSEPHMAIASGISRFIPSPIHSLHTPRPQHLKQIQDIVLFQMSLFWYVFLKGGLKEHTQDHNTITPVNVFKNQSLFALSNCGNNTCLLKEIWKVRKS